MFSYLFPIFCFGLVMTGIVFLGIIEAAKHLQTEEARIREPRTLDLQVPAAPRKGQAISVAVPSIHE